jgi:hypothetical protein
MNKNLLKWNLLPADRIVVPKSDLRFVQHHAIYLGKDASGTDWIAENKVGRGVQIVTATDFFNDVIDITRVEPFRGTEAERKNAVINALALKGTNYDLLQFNCEHYANVVQHKQAVSHQVKTGIGLGFMGLIIGILLSKD